MSKDIEDKMLTELQELLREHPQMPPTPMRDDKCLITLMVKDGEPKVVSDPLPESIDFGIPAMADLQGTPPYRIYNLLRSLELLHSERDLTAQACILAHFAPDEVDGLVVEHVAPPPAAEVIHSVVSGQPDIKNRPDENGLLRNLEAMQKRFASLLEQNPELPPLVVSTTKETVAIRVSQGQLIVEPAKENGQPHLVLQKTIHVRLYDLRKSIRTLEQRLYGNSPELRLCRAGEKNQGELNLIKALQDLSCGYIAVFMKKSKRFLFLQGPEQRIVYRGQRTRVTEDQDLTTEAAPDPSNPEAYILA